MRWPDVVTRSRGRHSDGAEQTARWRQRHHFEIAVSAAVLFGGYLATWIGYYVATPGQFFPGGNVADRYLNWDASDYLSIAQYGYGHGPIAKVTYTWFPFMPLVDRVIHAVIGVWPPQVRTSAGWTTFADTAHQWSLSLYVVGPLAAGVASIWVFHRVSVRVWGDTTSAKVATAAYAAYPGSSFFFSGLPVGFTQLLVVLALREVLRRRYWWAAAAVGVATSIGPLNSLAVIPVLGIFLIDHWRQRRDGAGAPRRVTALRAVGLLVVGESGLIAYVLYLWITFGRPLAFVSSEQYFGGHGLRERLAGLFTLRDFNPHFIHLVLQSLYFDFPASVFPDLYLPINELSIVVLVALSLLVLRFPPTLARAERVVLSAYSLAAVAGFVWFIASQVGVASGPRIMYIAAPAFLSLGGLWRSHRYTAVVLIAVLAAASCAQVTLLVAGYFMP